MKHDGPVNRADAHLGGEVYEPVQSEAPAGVGGTTRPSDDRLFFHDMVETRRPTGKTESCDLGAGIPSKSFARCGPLRFVSADAQTPTVMFLRQLR